MFICLFSAETRRSIENIDVKEWQDGLRALLPNININFGGLPNSPSNSSSSSSVNHRGAPGGNVPHGVRWDGKSTWMDPAIITGKIHFNKGFSSCSI